MTARTTKRLTVAESAGVAGTHPTTIRRALEARTLHGAQRGKGGHWRIWQECLDAWLDNEPCPHQQATVTELDAHRGARTA